MSENVPVLTSELFVSFEGSSMQPRSSGVSALISGFVMTFAMASRAFFAASLTSLRGRGALRRDRPPAGAGAKIEGCSFFFFTESAKKVIAGEVACGGIASIRRAHDEIRGEWRVLADFVCLLSIAKVAKTSR